MAVQDRPLFDNIRKKSDGTYLSEREIIDELVDDIKQEPGVLAIWRAWPRDALIMAHHSMGQAIRNRFGLWAEDNPHVVLDPEPNADGVVDHPNHPDQASFRIIQSVWDRLHAETDEGTQH